MRAKFQQKILESEFVKIFNFSDKLPGFSKIRELCLNLGIGFWIAWLLLSNYKKISP